MKELANVFFFLYVYALITGNFPYMYDIWKNVAYGLFYVNV